MGKSSRTKYTGIRMFTSSGSSHCRRTILAGSLVLLANIAGCSIYGPTARNAFYEPHLLFDQTANCVRDCYLADSSWRAYRKVNADVFSGDYEDGFKAGFKAFLKHGANTGVPPVPPKHYWWIDKQGPDELAHAEDWREGYDRGVVTARESGFRDMTVVPALVPGLKTPDDTISLLSAMFNGPRLNAQEAGENFAPSASSKPDEPTRTAPPQKTAPAPEPPRPPDVGAGKPKPTSPYAPMNQ